MTIGAKLLHIGASTRAIATLFRDELSFRIQIVLGGAALLLAYAYGVDRTEFLFLLLAIGAVLAVEALNTSIEELCDHVTPAQHPQIARIKDLGSGAALLIGITASIAVIFTLGPRIFSTV